MRRTLLVALVLWTGLPGPASAGPTLAGCPMFPADSIWNTRVDTLPVHARSADYIATIGPNTGLHADFGSGSWNGGPIGIPYVAVSGAQPRVPVSFLYADESDPGPYPVPPDAPIEGGPNSTGDRHVLVLDQTQCRLYELYRAFPQGGGTSWDADSGAVFGLRSHALRPETWTSADAAGLPILAGLVRYDEVAAGAIGHAIRFTAQTTQRRYVWPARHYASSNTSPTVAPMGQRFRLRSSFDVSPFPAEVRVILTALKRYGLILADNGSNWFLSGVPDPRWNNDGLASLRSVKGSDFEAVDVSSLMIDPDSAQAASAVVAAVLPGSRSVQVGATATAFATIVNAGSAVATACGIAPATPVPGTFRYQTTDPATNLPTGSPDTPVDIAPGAAQTYVIAFTPSAPFGPTEVTLAFDCDNTASAVVIAGVNTLLLSASPTAVPDVIALAATQGGQGIVDVPGATGTGLFAAASSNVGVSGTLTVSADTGGVALPVTLTVCETNPATGACLGPPAPTATVAYAAGTNRSFAVFVRGRGLVPFDPARNRVFVRFRDAAGVTRGATSVAVRTQ